MTYGVGRRNRSRGLGWRTHSKEFQIGNFAYTPGSLHKEWQIKEISQGNVPDWRYDQRGQSPSTERVKMTAWRGRMVRRAHRNRAVLLDPTSAEYLPVVRVEQASQSEKR